MNVRKIYTVLAASLLCLSTATASHISGGEILYQCLGNNEYQITLNLFRDCAGIDMSTTETMSFDSPCGNLTLSLPLSNPGGTEISQLCPEDLIQSTCNNGIQPGMEVYSYTAVITLPPCDTWTMSWTNCCRNDAIDNLVNPGALDTYLQATLNSQTFPCDNSPTFNNVPIPYVCLNQPVIYGFGVSEIDGDSLNYTFIPAMIAGGGPVPYQAGYSSTAPIPGITLDQFTGLLTFTPTVQGNFVVTVMVTQYDPDTGEVIGTVMRDVQFVVIPCPGNQTPDPSAGAMANFSGTAIQVGPFAIEMCETDAFCFDFLILDPDIIDTLTLTTNVSTVLPGAVINYSGVNPVSGTICWTADAGTSGLHTFILAVADDHCPVTSFQTYVYTVNVLTRTSAGPDITICGPQVASLGAQGGANFTWSVLSGDPIQVGVNFSCNPCQYPIADPNNTTTYIVQSDLTGACINSDTVTVFVVGDFTYSGTQSDTIICLGETVQFNLSVTPQQPGYVYTWTPSTGLSATDIANPTGSYSVPGTYDYVVEMTSPDNCVHQFTNFTVTVVPAFAPEFTVTQTDYFVCEGESTQFFVELANGVPSFCGLNYSGCTGGVITQTDVGTSTNSNGDFDWPAIFGQFYTGNRNQMLFTAAELQSLGFVGGTISELAFNVGAIPGYSEFYDFEIKMGCTTQNELELDVWLNGLSTVFPADTINITTGWNTFTFAAGFNWDGVSNLVVEVCTDRWSYFGVDYTLNAHTYYTNTGFNAVHEMHSDQGLVCTDTPNGFTFDALYQNRPNTRFTYCSGINEDLINYTWVPPGDFSDPSSQNPIVTPSTSPATYTVFVGDTAFGCYSEATVTVNWYPDADVSFIPEPNNGVFPLNVFFNNTSASNVGNFYWTFGDGNDSAGVYEPNYIFTEPGTYYITLTGTDANGCFGSWTDSVVVYDHPIIVIPNVFSPNGDGENDTFAFVDYRGFEGFTMKFFNRWGQMVYQSQSVTTDKTAWAPKSDVPDGTYYYEFRGTGTDGTEVTLTGHVTLLR